MDWLFQNLGKLITFVIVVYYIVSAIRGSGAAAEAEEAQDPEVQERARKIQEEIRRKIIERQRQLQPGAPPPPILQRAAGPAAPAARPSGEAPPKDSWNEDDEEEDAYETMVARRHAHEAASRPHAVAPVPARVSLDANSDGENTYARQMREIEEQMRKADELRQKALHVEKGGLVSNRRTRSRAAALELRNRVITDLHGGNSIKAAVLLKEILDKPVGLR